MNPKVSIVLPAFNGAAYIAQSVTSCLNQSLKDLELIIVDDGSTDNTVEIINRFHDDRLRLVRQEKNLGHIAALNKGFSVARGDFLTWTSDDNYYAPQAMAKMLEALENDPGIDFVYSRYQIVDHNGNKVRLGKTEGPDYLDVDNCIGGCFLYRRKVYETIGDFNPNAFLAEDYEYWLRVRQKFRMKKLDDILYFYRMHEQSLTGINKEEKVQEQVQKVRDRFVPKWKRLVWRFKSVIRKH